MQKFTRIAVSEETSQRNRDESGARPWFLVLIASVALVCTLGALLPKAKDEPVAATIQSAAVAPVSRAATPAEPIQTVEFQQIPAIAETPNGGGPYNLTALSKAGFAPDEQPSTNQVTQVIQAR